MDARDNRSGRPDKSIVESTTVSATPRFAGYKLKESDLTVTNYSEGVELVLEAPEGDVTIFMDHENARELYWVLGGSL